MVWDSHFKVDWDTGEGSLENVQDFNCIKYFTIVLQNSRKKFFIFLKCPIDPRPHLSKNSLL